ncbi:MAG: family 43 glycosylhydrolase [Gemmatimonadaceae bacterium]|nr:family 43 glycosylhydrolase [Gemmatimonadaceae bacterium]
MERYAVRMRASLIVLLALVACRGSSSAARPPARASTNAGNPTLESRAVHAVANPILSDGVDYTSDPAPLVVDGKLYILTGRDMAKPGVNDFVMPEWQMLEANGNPMSGSWTHYPHFLKPDDVFTWASPGRAYAAQIVRGPNGKFYLYAPVVQAVSNSKDHFAIGVAVADTPLGPWVDAHPQGPVVSQSYPVANDIQNIDPTVLVDDDGRVYLYWGTFGRLKGVELAPDMVSMKGAPVDVSTLTGFFEAPWLFKRNGTYYLAYAGNKAGPESECTEAVYYACIAYGTSTSPLGPWTYRGVIVEPVSSTTSHPGIVAYKGAWYIAYHTADATNGGHFRRSVAIDRLEWDDGVSPARPRTVVPTGGAPFNATPIANIASHARVTASNTPIPVQYWLRALNDGKVRENPLPPDMWATWSRNNPAQQWSVYQWDRPVTLNASSVYFWGDHAAGSGVGVAPPSSWRLEYWDGAQWKPVGATTPYTTVLDAFNRVEFVPVTTRCLRAVFDASTDGATYAAVAAQEWQALSTRATVPRRRSAPGAASATCG